MNDGNEISISQIVQEIQPCTKIHYGGLRLWQGAEFDAKNQISIAQTNQKIHGSAQTTTIAETPKEENPHWVKSLETKGPEKRKPMGEINKDSRVIKTAKDHEI